MAWNRWSFLTGTVRCTPDSIFTGFKHFAHWYSISKEDIFQHHNLLTQNCQMKKSNRWHILGYKFPCHFILEGQFLFSWPEAKEHQAPLTDACYHSCFIQRTLTSLGRRRNCLWKQWSDGPNLRNAPLISLTSNTRPHHYSGTPQALWWGSGLKKYPLFIMC